MANFNEVYAENFYKAVLSLETVEECRAFFDDTPELHGCGAQRPATSLAFVSVSPDTVLPKECWM